MKKKTLTSWQEALSKMSKEKAEALENLFNQYYSYIYTYEIGCPENFNDKKKVDWKKLEFYQDIKDEVSTILVKDGY